MRIAIILTSVWINAAFFSSSSTAREVAYQLYLARGVEAINSLDFLGAVKEFREALAEKPGDLRSRFYLGLSLNRLGRQCEAIPVLSDLVNEHPEIADALKELGIARYYAGNYREARQSLEKIITEDPGDAQARYYLGLTRLALDDFPEAQEMLDSAAEIDAYYAPKARYQLALAHLRHNRVEKAVEEFSLAHELGPMTDEGIDAEELAERLSSGKKIRRIWGDVQARYEYDSNVILNPDDPDILDITDQADWRYSTTFTLNLDQPLNELMDWQGRYRFVQSTHHRLGDYNLLGNDLFNGLRVNLPHSSPLVGYRYEYYFLDDCKQSYLRSNTVLTSFTIPETWRAFTVPYYQMRRDDFMLPYFFDEDDRDAFNHTVGADQYILFTRDAARWIRGGVYYDRNEAQGLNYIYNGLRLSGEISTPLVCDVYLDFEAGYYIRNYVESEYHRYDGQQNYIVTLSRRFNECLDLGLQYELVLNDSTAPLFEYNRDIYSMIATINY